MINRSKKFAKRCDGPQGEGCAEVAAGRLEEKDAHGRYRGLTDWYQCEPCYLAWCEATGWRGPADIGLAPVVQPIPSMIREPFPWEQEQRDDE